MINSHVIDNYSQLSKLKNLRKNHAIFVLVYIPQCPYCRYMKPEWDTFKKQMNANALDVDILEINKQMVDDVQNYNADLYNHLKTVKYVPSLNLLQNTQIEPYLGDRKSNSFKNFLIEKVNSSIKNENKPKKDTQSKKSEKDKKSKKDKTSEKDKKSKKDKTSEKDKKSKKETDKEKSKKKSR